jgi:phosphonatase-like hydrolase
MSITLAMFDMAATTVDDTIDGRPLVLQSFADSFATAGVSVPWEVLNAQRGKDKRQVFQTLLARYRGLCGTVLAQATQDLLRDFTTRLLHNVERLHEMPGASAAFTLLQAHGVFVAVGSGFPLDVTQAIVTHLGWSDSGLVDYVTCGEAAGGGRPQPHMINRALQAAGLLPAVHAVDRVLADFDYRQVLKVGDTLQDIAEGLRVGALTVAVASGTQAAETLAQAGPAAVLPSVADLPDYLLRGGFLD